MNDDKIRISPDALIAMIVTEALNRELEQMPSLEEMNEDFHPSERFQRKIESLVRETKRKAEREKFLSNIKRFFITLTAAISIFSCTMLPVKAVREAVITTLIEWHDKFVSVIYVNDESSVTTFDITPSYIPNGFSQVETTDENSGFYYGQFRFLYKGIIIKHNKTEPTYTKTSLFLCEKRRFLWPGLRKEGNLFKLAGPGGLAFFHLTKKEVSKWPMKK